MQAPRMTRRRKMEIAPSGFYPDDEPYTLRIFDLTCPAGADLPHSERGHWQGQSDIEALDQDHFVLIVRSGVVRERAR